MTLIERQTNFGLCIESLNSYEQPKTGEHGARATNARVRCSMTI